MTDPIAFAHVQAVLRDIAPEADLTRVDRAEVLREELDLDSMDLLTLYTRLNERTGVSIPEADYPKVTTLDGLIGYLVAHGG